MCETCTVQRYVRFFLCFTVSGEDVNMLLNCVIALIFVLIEVFLIFSFGKRSAGSFRRGCECIVLEPSEMIVVRIFSFSCFQILQTKFGNISTSNKTRSFLFCMWSFYKSKMSYVNFLPFFTHILALFEWWRHPLYCCYIYFCRFLVKLKFSHASRIAEQFGAFFLFFKSCFIVTGKHRCFSIHLRLA